MRSSFIPSRSKVPELARLPCSLGLYMLPFRIAVMHFAGFKRGFGTMLYVAVLSKIALIPSK
jgi:hypothetical protein